MATRSRALIRRSALCGTLAASLLLPTAAFAQSGSGDSATVKLIEILIAKGILTKGQAADLLTQAQSEAASAPAPVRHARHAVPIAPVAPEAENTPEAAPPGEVRVTYVPQFVRDQIASQVRTQVMQQVKSEGWAKPDELPEWTKRLTVYGDFRMRFQSDIEDKGNKDAATGLPYPFPDFNTINQNGGFDLSGNGSPPLLNVTENRDRFRIRARFGVRAQIADWITSDVRIATGNEGNPVSQNQTLGRPGDFAPYAIYIDRAYLKLTPTENLAIDLGRHPDPYFLSDLMFYSELNFDGASVHYDQPITDTLGAFVTGGAYPVFNTDLNFSSDNLQKGGSRDAYLFAGQAGARWRLAQNYQATLAAGYFAYSNVTGKSSAPCLLLATTDTCSTDDTIPSFEDYSNTVFGVRNFVTNASSIPQTPQLYGLSSHFGILDVHGKLDIKTYDPVIVSLEGEFVKNLEFNRAYILARSPANNFGSNDLYQGGDTGYMAKLSVGYPEIANRWDWNLSFAYKYLASDAVLDALTDPDFHLGGTNAKGYIVGGTLGVARNTNLTLRWLSASQVSGPPNGNDVLQIDLNAKF